MRSVGKVIVTLFVASCVWACGSEPQREVKPLTSRPTPTVDYTKLRTPEEKIAYIENSNAPESEKQAAIERIKAGKL